MTGTYEDVQMKDEYDFSGGTRGRYAKRRAKIKADGRYFIKAIDYANNTAEIKEIEAGTHKVLSSRVVAIQ